MSDEDKKYKKWKYIFISLVIIAVILGTIAYSTGNDLNLQFTNNDILDKQYNNLNLNYNDLNNKYTDLNDKYTKLVSDNSVLNTNYNNLKVSHERLQNILNNANVQLSLARQVSQSKDSENKGLRALLTQYEKVPTGYYSTTKFQKYTQILLTNYIIFY
jgi:chromosome segregation ATPase